LRPLTSDARRNQMPQRNALTIANR
jgi:hypothetical protein